MKTVSFFYPTGKKIGLGHQRRCQAIADYLTKNKLANVQFNKITTNTPVAICDFPSRQNISKIISNIKYKQSLFSRQLENQISNIKILLINNISPARFQADINIYPVAHFSPNSLDWENYRGKIYCGVKYFPINKEFLKISPKELTLKTDNHKIRRSVVLVSFGGSDVHNLTNKVIAALLPLSNIEIVAIIGPFFKNKSIQASKNVHLYKNPVSPASIMADATLAITAFGVTCWELAYLGIPTIIIYNFIEDEKDVWSFQKSDTSQVLGYYQNLSSEMIRKSVKKLLNSHNRLKQMSKAGKKLVDGRGSKRLANIIISLA